MTRKKVKLSSNVNDASIKFDELSTLCGIEACAIMYGPYEPQLEIWPSPKGFQSKMANQETFMKQSVMMAKKQVKKPRK
ncbi:MADS-box transcription factor family protein [Medicago truncatula]|uniref:MADS-box transcription factor family protein n=1 Tax=Medicago truncatula TaxID=3880 RepID=G7L081_MEDTR|nr:MADS-box transcription factor family protein [Medicago truncatula]